MKFSYINLHKILSNMRGATWMEKGITEFSAGRVVRGFNKKELLV